MLQPGPEILSRTYGHAKLTIEQMHPTKEEAVAAGHLYYFTGKPCKHGHVAPRLIAGKYCYCYVCKKQNHDKWHRKVFGPPRILKTAEQKAEQRRAYYQANREKIKAYRLANKERIKAQRQRHYEANKEKINSRNKAFRDANKDRISATEKAYYERNREEILAQRREYRLKNREKINQQARERYRRMKKEQAQS